MKKKLILWFTSRFTFRAGTKPGWWFALIWGRAPVHLRRHPMKKRSEATDAGKNGNG